MWNYSEHVMDHFLRPRNVGSIENADGEGEVGNIVCGDALKLFIKLDESGERLEDIKFQTFGCASAIASASALTELVKGKTVEEAEEVSNQDIAEFLGELPEEKMHCSVMGMEALQTALGNLRGENDGKATSSEHAESGDYRPYDLDRIVCYCFGVTERKIREVAKANALTEVGEITNYTKAGGGCGGCRDKIADILEQMQGEKKERGDAAGKNTSGDGGQMTNLQKMQQIQDVVENTIRPGLQADKGDLELVDIDGDRVIVRLQGNCAGCAGAHVTLKRWVEAKLKEQVSNTLTVEEADD